MAKPRIIVTIEPQERSALMRMAEAEKRTDRAQAAYLIRQALERAGLIPRAATQTGTQPQFGDPQ